MKRRATIGLCLIAVLGAALLPLCFGGRNAFASLSTFPSWAISGIVVLMLVSWIAKGLKFQMLMIGLRQRCGPGTGIAIALGCDFAFIATPAGLGGYAATVFLCKRVGATASAGTALAAADQTLDLIFFVISIPLALLWLIANGTPTGVRGERLLVLGVLIAVCAVVMHMLGRDRWNRLGNRLLRLPVVRRYDARLRRGYSEVLAHLRELRCAPWSRVTVLFGLTAAQWLARYAVLGLALAGFGYAVPMANVLLLQSVALHAGQWTGVPGGVGGADLIIAQGLRESVPVAAVASAILTWRIATLYGTLLAGAVAFVGLSMQRRDRPRGAHHVDGLPGTTS